MCYDEYNRVGVALPRNTAAPWASQEPNFSQFLWNAVTSLSIPEHMASGL